MITHGNLTVVSKKFAGKLRCGKAEIPTVTVLAGAWGKDSVGTFGNNTETC